MKELNFPVVIVGAGGGGCAAAIQAARSGASVALLSKESLGIGNTRMSGGEMTSSGVREGDSPEVIQADMMQGGENLNDPELVEHLARNATAAIQFIESLGAYFGRDEEGRLSAKAANRLGGHSFHRSFISPAAGMSLGQVMRNGVVNTPGITSFEEAFAFALLRQDGEVGGVLALDMKTSEILFFRACITVLATGGCGWLYYPQTTNNRSATGDGYALALEAGAKMVDMEMVQFFPFGMNHPTCFAGSILDEPVLAGPKGKLINGLGQIVADHDINRLTRAQVTAIMAREISAGRATRWGGLQLDLGGNLDVPEMIEYKRRNDERRIFEKVLKGYGEEAFNWKAPWDVSPSAHYMMGGVKIDRRGRASVPGLYAVGEAAGGVMGANRLGSTSLADIFVMGIEVGKGAVAAAKSKACPQVSSSHIEEESSKVRRLFNQQGERRPIQLIRELQQLMREKVGIVRDEQRLIGALTAIDRLETEAARGLKIAGLHRYNTEVIDALELKGMLLTARMIAFCARMRQESRAAHLRLDYPEKDEVNWRKNIILWKENGQIRTAVR